MNETETRNAAAGAITRQKEITMTNVLTLEQLATIAGGKISRDGQSVVVGYGSLGYLRLRPTTVILDGAEMPAAAIDGRLARRNGGSKSDLRDKLRAAGIYPC